MNLENVREIAETGVEFISIGALTHSAPTLDFSMLLDARLGSRGGVRLASVEARRTPLPAPVTSLLLQEFREATIFQDAAAGLLLGAVVRLVF